MRPPFFAFYPSDFADDFNVAAMSTLQVGAYVLLLCKAWQADPPASLPNDDQILARLARVDAATWTEIRAGVLAPFRLGSDGKLHSKRLRKEYDEALKRIRAAKERGKSGAETRWAKGHPTATKPVTGTTDSGSIGASIDGALLKHCLSNGRDMPLETEEERREEKTPLPPATGGGTESSRPASLPFMAPPGPEPGFDLATLAASAVEPLEPWDELVREWVAAKLPGWDVPGGIQRTAHRVEAWQLRLRDPAWRSRWREAIRLAGRSLACRGLDPGFLRRGLRLQTFLEKPETLIRIFEGDFGDGAAVAPGAPVTTKTKREREMDAALAEYKAKEAAKQKKAG